jgi:alanyl-tRNA synthetase
MKGSEIRSAYLRYFEERGHRVVSSGPLVPDRDPTLMFANSGMVQFKRLFLGEETRDYTRAVTAQKCMRVSGKHNDLDQVGRTPKHHTFFEMLGNFSFGDYFKQDAIDYAWDFVTNVLRLDGERLVVSILKEDDEALELWRDRIGIPMPRIYKLGPQDNFWQMGDTGPCGPNSEIHWMTGPACGPDCNPSCDCGRFVEIWNLVFMQYEQQPGGERVRLPKPSIDTGMGLERTAAVLQSVASNYETDLFQPIIRRAAELASTRYGKSPESDVSLQVIADHARACTFLIGEGLLPSNEGRGYVLRRVLRRAARHGWLLGIEEPFLYEVASAVAAEMGAAYPDVASRLSSIQDTIKREEERFLRTLARGLDLLDTEIERARAAKSRELSGEVVFKLYDTFGFPTDLTEDILRSKQLSYDRSGFDAHMREQAERARAAWKGSGAHATPAVYQALADRGPKPVQFSGYDALQEQGNVRNLLLDGVEVETVREGDRVEIVTHATPFYAESGGQVGDVGEIIGPNGRITVEDTQRPVDGLIVHHGVVSLGSVSKGEAVELQVDAAKRAATIRNHSGTHLFHWALRQVLGPQVTQRGSLVAPDRLRFDFSYDSPLSADQIHEIEDLVNDRILRNTEAVVSEKTYADAMKAGAMALFSEKYGDRVRVVQFGESVELCGGTHAHATGDIGLFRIIGQSAIGAGVRRVEAQTGLGVLEHARGESRALNEAAQLLRVNPAELASRIGRLLEREKELERELEKTRQALRKGGSSDPLASAREIGGVKVIATEIADADPKELRGMVDDLKARLGSGLVLLATRQDGRASLAMGVTDDLVSRFQAGKLIADVAGVLGGKGGGRADFAQAGGPQGDELPRALERFQELVASRS